MKAGTPTENKLTLHSGSDDTQTAILNVLTDYKDIAHENARSRRAILNVLEDLEESNAALVKKTLEVTEASERILQKNAIDTAILESIGDGIVVTDSNRIITFVNHAFEVLTGWNSNEVVGRDIISVLPTESETRGISFQLTGIITDVLQGKNYCSDISKPFYNVRKDRTRFPASSTITPVWLNGAVIGLVKSFRDITKEMDIDKAKTEFVSLASHQFRTPLSAINWYTEMLRSGDVGPITVGQEKYLNEIHNSNQRMLSLVNALLNVTRMTLGTFVLEPEMFDFAILIQSVLQEQTPESEKKQLLISTVFEPGIPMIESDAKLLRMVLQNLISNAIKYTPKNGRIKLSLCLDDTGTRFLFTITDTGTGIPANQHKQIFNRLFRADNVRTEGTEGSGLGLYIVKAIIQNSGGRVWFESEEHVGSTFYVELPAHATITT